MKMSEAEMLSLCYEKNLMEMKFRILISSQHEKIMNELVEISGISIQVLRTALIHRTDMILLEAIPPRYHAYQSGQWCHPDQPQEAELSGDDRAKFIFTYVIPILTEKELKSAYSLLEILTQTNGERT
jgi:hypothetical protein